MVIGGKLLIGKKGAGVSGRRVVKFVGRKVIGGTGGNVDGYVRGWTGWFGMFNGGGCVDAVGT